MKKYNQEKSILSSIEKKLKNKPQYRKMLNNLLGINNWDNATFMSSKINNFNLKNLLNNNDYKKIFNNKTFDVKIRDVNDNVMIEALEFTSNFEEFNNIIHHYGIFISKIDKKLLDKNFSYKEKIINKIKRQKSKKMSKWKMFKNRYLDKQVQTNSWPLYIGTMFIKVKNFSKTIYAPLVLKKVEILITKNNEIKIKSVDDSIDVNEKLLFLLQNIDSFSLPKLNEEKEFSLKEVIEIFAKSLNKIIGKKIDFCDNFNFLKRDEIKNTLPQYAPGIILSIISPSGGVLRDKLIKLIKKDAIEDILDVDVLKDFKSLINKKLENKESIYRINPTDFSQEKAIIGALNDHAIIWGPPGTGKSQVISNIIANLLVNNSSVIVTSEKKAALDVIKERMGKLSKFMFFGLVDKKINKKLFYKPFNDLLDYITKIDDLVDHIENDNMNIYGKYKKTLMTDAEWKMFDQKQKLNQEKNIKVLIEVWNILKKEDLISPNRSTYLINSKEIIDANKNVLKEINDDENFEQTINRLGYQKKGIIWKRYSKEIRKLKKLFYFYNQNINLFNKITMIYDLENLNKIEKFLENEKKFQNDKTNFQSDEIYLEMLLVLNFKDKIEKLKKDIETKKQINSFLKNCKSGWRIPYKFVNIYKKIIRELFSVFVSTPQTLAKIINMNKEYDYVIFDEASQMHLEKSIPFICMSKKAIIAGDHQQMKPTNWMRTRDNSTFIDEDETDVDSLLEFASRKGLNTREYMLTKNYRSKSSELMMFSSKEFYKSNLDVLDNKEFINKKSIEVYDVDGKWETRTNEKEANAALKKLIEVANNFEKIILLTLNSNQKQYIESLIYNKEIYNPIIKMLEKGKLFLRNLENIQGDEANLVIVSVAYDKNARFGSTYVARPEGKNALNVAISRAIEKMIVFKSIKSTDIFSKTNNDSIRVLKEWLRYLELKSIERKKYLLKSNKKLEKFDSGFEEKVYDHLAKNLKLPLKAKIQTQFLIGSYSVDIAIINLKNDEFMLGIEVDGYRYHSGFEKMIKDIERQKFIEAKGYPIYRITEINWRINKKDEINKIIQLLSS